MKHTKTPWIIDDFMDRWVIGPEDKSTIVAAIDKIDEISDANTRHICKCVNLHDELVDMLKRYRKETPLGNQPHMIAGKADVLIAKAESEV